MMYWLELAPGILIIGVICTIAAVIIWATNKETGAISRAPKR
jgi:hypothetical protein